MQTAMIAKKPRKQAISGRFWAGHTYRGRIKDDHKIEPYEGTPVFLDETADSLRIMRHDEIGSEENEWTPSNRSLRYESADAQYNNAVKAALLSSEPTGLWSAAKDSITLFDSRKVQGIPDEFYQIIWTNTETGRNTFFYLIHDPLHQWIKYTDAEWIVDEPNFGVFGADDELIRLVQEYDQHITILEGIILGFRNVFEYDPHRVWKDPMYKDGRFDTYRYLTLTDKETGEDVTASFIEKYMEAYQNEEWETLLAAMETVQESWAIVYVNPEAAHMEGSS